MNCEDCEFCKKFVRVKAVWNGGSAEEFFDWFCVKKFQPVLDSGAVLGCSDGKPRPESGCGACKSREGPRKQSPGMGERKRAPQTRGKEVNSR